MAILEKLQSSVAKILIAFFLLGFLISFIAAISGQVGLSSIIFRPIFYGILMVGLGYAIFQVLKRFTPEVIETLEKKESSYADEATSGDGFNETNESLEDASNVEDPSAEVNSKELFSEMDSSNVSGGSSIPKGPRKKNAANGDELLVEGIPIKNEPKLMAEAIKHLIETQGG